MSGMEVQDTVQRYPAFLIYHHELVWLFPWGVHHQNKPDHQISC